jgi:hypothetical protein
MLIGRLGEKLVEADEIATGNAVARNVIKKIGRSPEPFKQ